jgi:hypothetical protein
VLSKVYRKILVLFRLVQNFEILDLAMVKVEKVNITVTYLSGHRLFIISHVENAEEKGL